MNLMQQPELATVGWEEKVGERSEPLPVLCKRIEEGMTNENGVNFVDLLASISNVFFDRGEKDVRTYASSEPRTIRTHLVEGLTSSPSSRCSLQIHCVFSVSRRDHNEEEGMMTTDRGSSERCCSLSIRRRRGCWRWTLKL